MLPVTPSVGVGVAAPKVQKKPAWHGPAGAVLIGAMQYWPAGHGTHCETAERSVTLEKVPLGQRNSVAKRVEAGQYEPAGHAAKLVLPRPAQK
jgi:hypothetical protein